jgi:hypothetical protein
MLVGNHIDSGIYKHAHGELEGRQWKTADLCEGGQQIGIRSQYKSAYSHRRYDVTEEACQLRKFSCAGKYIRFHSAHAFYPIYRCLPQPSHSINLEFSSEV